MESCDMKNITLADWMLVRVVMALVLVFIAGCDAISGTQDGYEVASTGIETSSYNWCDNNHLIVASKGEVFLVDVRDLKQTPVELFDEKGQKLKVISPSCNEGQVYAPKWDEAAPTTWPGKRLRTLYAGPIGARAAPLISPTERVLATSLKGKYILAQMPVIKTDDSYKIVEECAMYHNPDYKLMCFYTEAWFNKFFALEHFIVAPYRWGDTLSVRKENGTRQQVKNLRAPLLLDKDIPITRYVPIPGEPGANKVIREPQPPGSQGLPVTAAILLYDLNLNLLARLDKDSNYKVYDLGFVVGIDEAYLYSPCIKRRESKYDQDYDGVCRYKLDGKQNQWENMFSFDLPKKERTGIAQISVSQNEDIYFSLGGDSVIHRGLWKFDASTRKITQITHVVAGQFDKEPKVSPDGKRVAFHHAEKGEKLFIVQPKGFAK